MNSTSDGAGDADVLAALRHATASRHEALDSGLPLSKHNAGLADYASHLLLMHAWLAPLSAWLDGFDDGPHGAGGLPQVDRVALIETDLADPSFAAAGLATNPAGRTGARSSWPREASPAYRWGICYVIEGSQLGGTVLYQRLHERLAPHPLSFLRGPAGGPGPRWRTFMQALRANVRSEADIADACAGACDAFDTILALAFPEHA